VSEPPVSTSPSSPRRCPITYEPLAEGEELYSAAGLRRLSPHLAHLDPLPFTAEELVREAARRAEKMSIGGVQPKVSAVLRPAEGRFELVDTGGRYLLKPENPLFPEVPANEDLTMRMAAAAGIETPLHGLAYTKGGGLCYFVRRFDRMGRGEKLAGEKLAVEDFAQLLGLERETKYDGSMEQVAKVVEQYCTFPLPQKQELFRRTLVVFLTGNEDHHVKNFSILTTPAGIRQLAPAYDMVCSTIALQDPREELALPLRGKKARLRREDLIEYYGAERLGLRLAAIERVLADVAAAQPTWDDLLSRSFLSEPMKARYAEVLAHRRAVLRF
jgi:serine/threonine-protein kinase HipA